MENVVLLKIDTKSKILTIIVFLFFLISIISIEQLLFAFLYWVVLLVVFKARIRQVFLKATPVFPLIISLGILTWWGKTEGSIMTFGDATVNYSRTGLTLFFVLRSMLLVFTALLIIESEESFFKIIYALDDLYVPDLIINVLLFMYRTFLDLKIEGEKMLNARYSRGSYKSSWAKISEYKLLGYMLGSIFVRASYKSHSRKDALISRMYDGIFRHEKTHFTSTGVFILWVTTIFCLIILLISKVRFFDYGMLSG